MTQEDAFLAAIVQEGGRGASHLVYADWLDEQGREQEAMHWRAGRVALDYREKRLARALTSCRFAPATADKRFAREVCSSAERPEPWTVAQWAYLWTLGWRYRKQLRAWENLASRVHPFASLVHRAALLNGKEAGPTPARARPRGPRQ